ncbi:MAG: XdhC family protein [Devosia sp.]
MNYLDIRAAAANVPCDVGLDPDNPASAFGLLLSGLREGIKGALLTIINIEGGAPRSLGTHMAVLADGRYCGYVSGGCVEAAVAAEAMAVMARGHDEVLRFGRNSPFFDIRLPCGGGIDVHVHVNPAPKLLEAAATNLSKRHPFDIALNAAAGAATIVDADGAIGSSTFRRRYRPATRLVLIEQGNELAVMASTARAAGLDVSAYATGSSAIAAALRVGTPVVEITVADELPELGIDPWTAVIFLFHDHDSEAVFLRTALQSQAFYVGALGSRRTHTERVSRLLAAGLPEEAISRIHAPIGMIERTREATPLAFSVLADITRERMRLES